MEKNEKHTGAIRKENKFRIREDEENNGTEDCRSSIRRI